MGKKGHNKRGLLVGSILMDNKVPEEKETLLSNYTKMDQKKIEWRTILKARLFWRIIIFMLLAQILFQLLGSLRNREPKLSADLEKTLSQFYIYRDRKTNMTFTVGHDGDWTTQRRKIFSSPRISTELLESRKRGKGRHFEKIVVGTVSCSYKAENLNFLNKTLVMLKSALISAQLNGIKEMDFHLFLEYKEHESLVIAEVQSWMDPENGRIKLQVYFHDPVQLIPEQFQDHMVYHHRFRCGYVRFFFESTLPMVDALIYLDADILITGSILHLWEQFYRMSGAQLIGGSQDTDPKNKHYEYLPHFLFGDMPYVPPRGINSGVLLMNLTKMREFGWQEKLLRIYTDYSKIYSLNDQKLLNIMLYYNPHLLIELGCQFNFIHTRCSKGFSCTAAELSDVGIEVVHGANRTFQEGGIFRKLWEQYLHFNVQTQNVSRDLMEPVRRLYAANASEHSPCYGSLGKQLFKHGRQKEKTGGIGSDEVEALLSLEVDSLEDFFPKTDVVESSNTVTGKLPLAVFNRTSSVVEKGAHFDVDVNRLITNGMSSSNTKEIRPIENKNGDIGGNDTGIEAPIVVKTRNNNSNTNYLENVPLGIKNVSSGTPSANSNPSIFPVSTGIPYVSSSDAPVDLPRTPLASSNFLNVTQRSLPNQFMPLDNNISTMSSRPPGFYQTSTQSAASRFGPLEPPPSYETTTQSMSPRFAPIPPPRLTGESNVLERFPSSQLRNSSVVGRRHQLHNSRRKRPRHRNYSLLGRNSTQRSDSFSSRTSNVTKGISNITKDHPPATAALPRETGNQIQTPPVMQSYPPSNPDLVT